MLPGALPREQTWPVEMMVGWTCIKTVDTLNTPIRHFCQMLSSQNFLETLNKVERWILLDRAFAAVHLLMVTWLIALWALMRLLSFKVKMPKKKKKTNELRGGCSCLFKQSCVLSPSSVKRQLFEMIMCEMIIEIGEKVSDSLIPNHIPTLMYGAWDYENWKNWAWRVVLQSLCRILVWGSSWASLVAQMIKIHLQF